MLLLLGPASSASAAGPAEGPPFKAGEIVVAGAPGPHLAGLQVAKYLPNADLTLVKVEKGREFAAVQRFLKQGRRAGVNRIAQATAFPDDTYYHPYQWNFAAVQSDEAWAFSDAAGDGVIVAVLDTGIASGGNDGVNCTTFPIDVVNNDDNPDDGNGHGTHVSGTIAQTTNNSTGVAGLAYNACIMPVKVLDDEGSGSFADISDGIYYAVNNGAQVINMSLGINARYGLRNDPIMDPALDYAFNHGVTVVCASGNDSSKSNVSYPAIYKTTIAIGATDYKNNVTRYSNKGEGLDLVAPGGDSTRDFNHDGYGDGILQETRINGEWGYYFFEGTSMATPHVAAIAAMLLAENSTLSPQDILTRLTSTARDLYEAGYDSTSGYGLVQAYNALTDEQGGGSGGGVTGTDADGDGVTIEAGDCNDNDPNVYPGHQDTKGKWGHNGVDNDCNGIIDG